MHLCLFEDDAVAHLRPLVDTRAVYDLRLAVRTLRETAVDAFEPDATLLHARSLVASLTEDRGPGAAAEALPSGADVLFVNGRLIARDGPLTDRIRDAADRGARPTAFVDGDTLVAAWVPDASSRLFSTVLEEDTLDRNAFGALSQVEVQSETGTEPPMIRRLWHLLDALPAALERDLAKRCGPYNVLDDVYSRQGTDVHESVTAVNSEQIVLAEGATVRPGAILNASDGPILVDEDAAISEQAVVRGPCYVGPKTQIKTAADVGASAFGYYCKVGGEVHDVVFHSLSNKSHAGFLGHSYLGRWCNLGADTNTSNLKNDYGEVTMYDPVEGDFVGTGRQFAGLVMGDHSKCGINTMFNTGTVVGTCCNVFDAGFPPRYLPAFSWGSPQRGFTTYRLDKALEVAEHVMSRRDRAFTDAHRRNLETLFEATESERTNHT